GGGSGSRSGGQGRRKVNGPGTPPSTKGKSPAPVNGNLAVSPRSGPNTSVITCPANAASVASLTVTGYSPAYSASAVSPCASAMSLTSRGTRSASAVLDSAL